MTAPGSEVAPLVSVCIRGWRRSTLPRAVESALTQTIDDLEVIVSDDRGDLEDVALSFGDARVRYFRNAERLGPAWNAREALSRARGRYIGLLNDDDRLLPDFAEVVLGRFASTPEVGLVFTNQLFDEGGRIWQRPAPVADGTYREFLVPLLRAKPFPVGAALMRREVWEQGERLQPIPRRTVPDAFIYVRAAAAGIAFSYVDRALLVWTLAADTLTATRVIRDLAVELWSGFVFADPEAEHLRLDLLAEAYVSRAAGLLQSGQGAQAREDLRAARALGRSAPTLSALALVPPLAGAAAAAKRFARRRRAPWLQ